MWHEEAYIMRILRAILGHNFVSGVGSRNLKNLENFKKNLTASFSKNLGFPALIPQYPYRRLNWGCCVDSRSECRARSSSVCNSWHCGRNLRTCSDTSPTLNTSNILLPLLECRSWCCTTNDTIRDNSDFVTTVYYWVKSLRVDCCCVI